MKQFLLVIVLAVVASVCGAQDCPSNVDRTAQMKEAIMASHGKGVYFEVNGCVWKPGKNPRDTKTVKPALPQTAFPSPYGGILLSASNTVHPGPCGWFQRWEEDHLLVPDKDGLCRLHYNFHFGPDDADCRFVSSADGKTLGVTCTWKPTKDGAK